MTAKPGVDVYLTAEIITQTREKSRSLGLDPADSTAEELYYALLARAEHDDVLLRQELSIDSETTIVNADKIIATTVEKLTTNDLVVSLQSSAVKKILKSVPPKKTMRVLKFRSINAVLKREDPFVLYTIAKKLEDKTWHTQVQARLKRLDPRDVTVCPVRVVTLPSSWLEKIPAHMKEHIVHPVAETGSVLILPVIPVEMKGSIVLTTTLVLQAVQRLAVESLPYRAKSMQTNIESLIPQIAAGYVHELKSIYGLQPTWMVVYQLLAEQTKQRLPEFEFVLSDIMWEHTEARLSRLHTTFDFWTNTHYLGHTLGSKLPISLHIVDVVASLVLGRKFGDQTVSHLRSSLWNELQVRYLKQEPLERAIIDQLTVARDVSL